MKRLQKNLYKSALFSTLLLTSPLALATNNDAPYQALGSTPPEQVSVQDKNSLFANHSENYYNYNAPHKTGLWLDAGGGYGGTGDYGGAAGGASLNLRYGDDYYSVFSTSVLGTGTVNASDFSKWDNEKRNVRDVGILFGKMDDFSWGYTTYGLGLAYAHGRPQDDANTFSTIGLPLQAQAMWTPWRYVGFGIKAFGAVNGRVDQSNYGAMLQIAIGRFQ